MASYTILANALSESYVDDDGQTQSFENETYHPYLITKGISRFMMTFTDDSGASVTQVHEVQSTDPEEIDRQLKLTLTQYNNINGNYTEPNLPTNQAVNL